MDYSSQVKVEEEIQTRMRLYDFSTGKQTFFQWQAGMLPSLKNKTVLELGCGNGVIWRDLLPRWNDCRLTLTDIADDVLESARTSLSPFESMTESLTFESVDFNQLPYEDESFDVLIANHNLYYALDVDQILESIYRLLKPGGMLICSTIGKDHLHELVSLLRIQNSELPWGAERWAELFGLEAGAGKLMQHFNHVDQFEYDNNLHVNSSEPVMSYLQKTMKGAIASWVKDNHEMVQKSVDKQITDKGYFKLTPHSGFFIAYKESD
jgi:ubiquinone/menaquinone biosynthesis C-methylase UbiE